MSIILRYDHKASMNLRVNLPDEVIDYETQFGE